MANDGKWLEQKVVEAVESLKKVERLAFYRFYDSKSARGALPAQPADWLLSHKGTAYLVEAKSTEGMESNLISLIKGSSKSRRQIAEHRLWHLSGNQSLYILGCTKTKQVTLYDGRVVVTYLVYMPTQDGRTMPSLASGDIKELPEFIRYAINKR